jgi:LPXTG-site transpeptidase (sortase) family protein
MDSNTQNDPGAGGVNRRSTHRAGVVMAVVGAFLAVVAGLIFVTGALSDNPSTSTASTYDDLLKQREVRGDVHAEPTAPSVLGVDAKPTGTPGPREFTAPAERLRIESIGVDAPLIYLNINAQGNMDVPTDPDLVAWYDFTAKPGLGTGNAVFSGHVDYRGHGPAVFWDLTDVALGDLVEVQLRDGVILQYEVTGAADFPVAELDMAEVLASTTDESITLITCTGQFSGGQYLDRHIVRAVRVGVVEPGA